MMILDSGLLFWATLYFANSQFKKISEDSTMEG